MRRHRTPSTRRGLGSMAGIGLLVIAVLSACGDDTATDESSATTAGPDQPLSSCFWSEPVNREQSNTQFPDAGATYWFSSFTVPDGATLRLRGAFPHARYASFNVYGTDPDTGEPGTPYDVAADVDLVPDEGSTNPFTVGADRTASDRSYRLAVVGEPVPDDPGDRAANTLYGGVPGQVDGGPQDQELIYRVYVPDEGRNLLGDAGLPEIEVELADVRTVTSEEACAALSSDPVLPPEDELPSLSEDQYGELRALSDAPTHPAQPEPAFRRFFNPAHATFSSFYTGTDREAEIADLDATPFGGYYSNLDSDYVFAVIDRALGPAADGGNVAVVTGVAPRTPRTLDGAPTMGDGDLRYWSICQNESSVTTRVADCLFDEQVPRSPEGEFTIVVSRDQDRPENATADCGVGWLDWGPGDGVDRDEYGLLILRHMLPTPGFEQTIANVAEPGDEAAILGEYLPEVSYASPEEFEARGCPG